MMKKGILILLSFLATSLLPLTSLRAQPAIVPSDSIAFVNAEWQITVLDKHAQARCASIQMFNSTQYVSVIEYKAAKHETAILQLDDAGTATTDRLASEEGYTMAANGSYFNMKTFYPSTYIRIGDTVYGKTEDREMYRVNGVIGFKDRKGRKPQILLSTNKEYEKLTGKWHSVLAAGPVLMLEGKRLDYQRPESRFFNNRHPRTVIGYDKDGNISLVVIDGRFPEGIGTTIDETAIIASLLGLEDAINLDGGGSSTLWSEATGVLNHPYDNRRFDHEGMRKVPNCIAAKKR